MPLTSEHLSCTLLSSCVLTVAMLACIKDEARAAEGLPTQAAGEALGSGVLAAEADSWPEFRGPTGQGLSAATNVPVHWSATSNVSWTTPVPGSGWSSPVLADGKVYLTTAVGPAGQADVSLRALSLDALDGHVVWDVEVFRPTTDQVKQAHKKNTLASPTPVVSDGRLYVHFGHMGTAALDLDGSLVWRQADLEYSPVHGNGGSPVLVGDLLVFSGDGAEAPFVAAIDRANGRVRWTRPRNTPARKKFSFSTPLVIEVDGSTQIVSPGSGFVAGYDPRDGHEIWRVSYDEGYSVITRPVFAQGLLFVSSSYDAPVLYAIDPAHASGDVTETHVRWTHRRAVPNTPSPIVVREELYYVSDAGVATCADARTGEIHWQNRLGGTFSASPVFAEGRLYFQNEAGVTYVVRASSVFELLARNDLEARTLASAAVATGVIFVRTESHLWHIGKGS